MVLESRIQRNSHVNTPINFFEEQNKLASTQSSVERSNTGSNKAFIPFEAPTLPLVSFLTNNHFTQFIKTFLESIQAQE